jgi:hypothetical protein
MNPLGEVRSAETSHTVNICQHYFLCSLFNIQISKFSTNFKNENYPIAFVACNALALLSCGDMKTQTTLAAHPDMKKIK